MSFLLVVLGILLFPSVLVALVPRAALPATFAWISLGIGLIIIDEHSATAAPYDDDGVFFGPGAFEGWFWIMWVLTLAAFLARWSSGRREDPVPSAPTWLRWMLHWTIPTAALGCAAGMHWLRNRLAGAEEAQLTHFTLIGGALLVSLVVLWRKRSRSAGWESPDRLALASAGVVVLLVAVDAQKGFDLWSNATAFAAGRSHCIMTYGGFERQREARNGWDLSPLVNRRYGTWAASKAPVVLIGEPDGVEGYRWFNGSWRAAGSVETPCVPRPAPTPS